MEARQDLDFFESLRKSLLSSCKNFQKQYDKNIEYAEWLISYPRFQKEIKTLRKEFNIQVSNKSKTEFNLVVVDYSLKGFLYDSSTKKIHPASLLKKIELLSKRYLIPHKEMLAKYFFTNSLPIPLRKIPYVIIRSGFMGCSEIFIRVWEDTTEKEYREIYKLVVRIKKMITQQFNLPKKSTNLELVGEMYKKKREGKSSTEIANELGQNYSDTYVRKSTHDAREKACDDENPLRDLIFLASTWKSDGEAVKKYVSLFPLP
ncbi:MAG: hypothetical protein PHX21_07970 [bacterium]|nr:hypothetical protein [bacterium]